MRNVFDENDSGMIVSIGRIRYSSVSMMSMCNVMYYVCLMNDMCGVNSGLVSFMVGIFFLFFCVWCLVEVYVGVCEVFVYCV